MTKKFTIDRIQIHWGRMPVSLTFSYGKVSQFEFSIVRLFAGGCEGLGEVLIHPNGFLLEFLSTLPGGDVRCLDSLLPETKTDDERILCEAVSIALYDLVGRISGLSLHALLGGAKNLRVPLMPCIFPNNADEAVSKSAHYFEQGCKFLKTKLVGNFEEDLARVKAIRSVAPEGVVLQGDANEGYATIDEARRAVRELGASGLDVFEDPLKGGVEDYRKLRESSSGAMIMVDVLARRTEDLAAVLKHGAADVVGIHPDQAGSLSRVMQHVHLAQSFKIPVVIGGTGYTGVGTAAYQHLTAVATPGGHCGEAGGYIDHGMPGCMVRAPLKIENGFINIPNTPGIGVELDEDVLSEYEEGSREWTG